MTSSTARTSPKTVENGDRQVKAKSSLNTSSPWKGFLFGCVACCVAEGVTFPIDVVKTRLQLQGELGATRLYNSSFDAVSKMFAAEGIGAFYQGLAPALLRQATYGTLRYGLYEPIKDALGQNDTDSEGQHVAFPLWKKIVAGTLSGALSSALCNPTDLVKVRMQADVRTDGSLPRYRGTVDAFSTILREEGVTGLYRGVGPTCGRAAAGAATELATYDEIKQYLLGEGVPDGVRAHVASSLCAGFISTIATSPFDVIKSRMMNEKIVTAGKPQYSGLLDCATQAVRAEGVLSLWKGFWPNYARIGPRVVIIFLMLEKLRSTFD